MNRTRRLSFAPLAIAVSVVVGASGSGPFVARAQAEATAPSSDRGVEDRFGVFYVPRDPRTWEALEDLGVGWIRLPYRLGEHRAGGREFARVLNQGYALWLTVHYRDRANVPDAIRTSERGSYPPKDRATFVRAVRQLVEPMAEAIRARGKKPGDWLVLQFGNEVAPTDIAPDKPTRFWHGSGKQYLDTLAAFSEAVHAVDPDIPIAAGGFASAMLEWCITGEKPQAARWARRMMTEGRFDILDIHLYHDIDDIGRKVNWVRQYWKGPIATTELGGPDERTGPKYTDARHAEQLPRRVRAALDAGIHRVFWSFLIDIDKPGDPLAQSLGLIRRDWTRKPGFDAYAALIREYRTR